MSWSKAINLNLKLIIMKKRITIESLFRNSQHNLAEQPRPELWQRLEERLDQRQKGSRVFSLRFLSIAATLALLVVAMTVLTLINKKDQAYQAMFENQPRSIETLDAADANTSAMEAIALVQFYKEKKRREIEEGNRPTLLQPGN
jgi:hypothetical protein